MPKLLNALTNARVLAGHHGGYSHLRELDECIELVRAAGDASVQVTEEELTELRFRRSALSYEVPELERALLERSLLGLALLELSLWRKLK